MWVLLWKNAKKEREGKAEATPFFEFIFRSSSGPTRRESQLYASFDISDPDGEGKRGGVFNSFPFVPLKIFKPSVDWKVASSSVVVSGSFGRVSVGFFFFFYVFFVYWHAS